MIAALALVALAEPPRGEVIVAWAGNGDQSYGFATVQPALLRVNDASFQVRATISQQYYLFIDGEIPNRVGSPGVSVGPGFAYTPQDFALGLAVSLEARRSTRRVDGTVAAQTLDLDATFSGNAAWRPRDRSALYGLFSFSAANRYLWTRAGVMREIVPLRDHDSASGLWLGLEGTGRGPEVTRVWEVGPVVEVPVRDLGVVFSARGGIAFYKLGRTPVQRPTFGLGVYWAY